MTMNKVWLALVLVASHIVQLMLVLKPSCANIMKTISPSDSLKLEKNRDVLCVSFAVTNEAMVPSKLNRHLHTKHSYFKMLIADLICQAKQYTKITTISD
jgi:hypothetical protein